MGTQPGDITCSKSMGILPGDITCSKSMSNERFIIKIKKIPFIAIHSKFEVIRNREDERKTRGQNKSKI